MPLNSSFLFIKLHWNASRPLCTIRVPRGEVFDAADSPTFSVDLHYGNIQFINAAQYQTWPHFSDYVKIHQMRLFTCMASKNDVQHNCTQIVFVWSLFSNRPHLMKYAVPVKKEATILWLNLEVLLSVSSSHTKWNMHSEPNVSDTAGLPVCVPLGYMDPASYYTLISACTM